MISTLAFLNGNFLDMVVFIQMRFEIRVSQMELCGPRISPLTDKSSDVQMGSWKILPMKIAAFWH